MGKFKDGSNLGIPRLQMRCDTSIQCPQAGTAQTLIVATQAVSVCRPVQHRHYIAAQVVSVCRPAQHRH